MTQIVIVGGGTFGTALANQLAANRDNKITLLVRNPSIEAEIQETHRNDKYAAGRELPTLITASTKFDILQTADIALIALPSQSIPFVVHNMSENLAKETIVVNMAKGIMDEGKTIAEYLREELPNNEIASWKGASFSAEMMNHVPTMLTLGYSHVRQLKLIMNITEGTNLFSDYTTDITGVEILSALKNIYAILLGHVDAKFNAANTRFMVLTKAFGEIRLILNYLGGRTETLFLSCGIGDISLTALNDLSRNRTLGLLIGKGFFNAADENNPVVLEGVKTLKLVDRVIDGHLREKLPLFNGLVKVLVTHEKQSLDFDFNKLIRRNFTMVLTYGVFDLRDYRSSEWLRRAKRLGDRLIVGLVTDELNRENGIDCLTDFKQRKDYLESFAFVDLVIPVNSFEQKTDDVQTYDIGVFVASEAKQQKFTDLEKYCRVVYLSPLDNNSGIIQNN